MSIHERLRLLPRPHHVRPHTECGKHRVPSSGQAHGAAAAARHISSAWRTLLVPLPAQLDESNAAHVKASLLAAVGRQPHVLIADMSRTRWCDWAGAGALATTFRQAAAVGTELRLVLTDESVRRVISVNGLDQLMPVYQNVPTASAVPPRA